MLLLPPPHKKLKVELLAMVEWAAVTELSMASSQEAGAFTSGKLTRGMITPARNLDLGDVYLEDTFSQKSNEKM